MPLNRENVVLLWPQRSGGVLQSPALYGREDLSASVRVARINLPFTKAAQPLTKTGWCVAVGAARKVKEIKHVVQ